ncbi:MAG: glycosyltransferase [Myxococcota bacterium]
MALVHDWLTGYRGGERVLLHLAQRHPQADLFTLIHERGSVPSPIEARTIHTSVLDRLPGRARHYRKLLPLFPWAIERFDFSGYDLVLSTSHAVAKSVRVPEGVPHVDYCFTPMRYVWDRIDSYLGHGARRTLARPLVRRLRAFDVRTSGPDRVTRFVAISTDVADRIARHYGRKARVVAPPVDTRWITPATAPGGDFYLLVGSFVPYKREDLVLEAFRRNRRPLVVVGDGPGRAALERSAPPNVRFVGRVPDETLAALYREARALVYPQHEDFGLVAVEAQAAGRPVIGLGRGGLVDTVVPLGGAAADPHDPLGAQSASETIPLDATGVFFHEQTPAALCEAIERFEKVEHRFDPRALRRWSERFSPARFDRAFDAEIALALGDAQRAGRPAPPAMRHAL